LLKTGRVRISLSPNPFQGDRFTQQLILKDGFVKISGQSGNLQAEVNIWVDVFRLLFTPKYNATGPLKAEATFESWRYFDRPILGRANNANSYKWAPQGEVKTFRDSISFTNNAVRFFHANRRVSVFDVTVKQQGMEQVKDQLFQPTPGTCFLAASWKEQIWSLPETLRAYIDTISKDGNSRAVNRKKNTCSSLPANRAGEFAR
jgi:hypothetical protein